MIRLSKSFTFEASHVLTDHDGKCRNLHGHSYTLTIHVDGDSVLSSGPKRGMLVDFADVSACVKPLVKEFLDHKHLNDTLPVYPTSENIAEWVRQKVIPHLYPLDVAVTLSETDSSEVTVE